MNIILKAELTISVVGIVLLTIAITPMGAGGSPDGHTCWAQKNT